MSQKIDDPLYNSRLMKNYVVYVQQFYPLVDIDPILEYAWMKPYELEDQGHWFSQWQVDRFHERLSTVTKNPEISREVGRYTASEAYGALKQYIMGFLSPSAVYWMLEKFAPHLTRASTYKTRKLGSNKIEVLVTPNPGVAEKSYQCDNRCGIFEAIPNLFTNSYARVEHTTCIHQGGDVCRYIITWDSTHTIVWRRIRYYLIIGLGLISCSALYFFAPLICFAISIFVFALIIVMIVFHTESVEKRELTKNIKEQSNAARLLLNEINLRYSHATLIKDIGQTTSRLMEMDELFNAVIESIEKHLDYDRGGIWVVNTEKTKLCYKIGYGYDPEIEGLLKNSDFHLRPESKGVAVQAFLKQRPFLVNNIREIEGSLSLRSFEFVKKTGAQSFICVPLVYESDSFGVLFVDNIKAKRP
ncbi:MAG: GAF domain-containing protein, partial [Deltaproteobacteria bacterium]|nr:GAF domain-containing protein [Deltaproteobacteria bacterium]